MEKYWARALEDMQGENPKLIITRGQRQITPEQLEVMSVGSLIDCKITLEGIPIVFYKQDKGPFNPAPSHKGIRIKIGDSAYIGPPKHDNSNGPAINSLNILYASRLFPRLS
ncbi:MAG: hypothetical protein AABW91_04050 [Nanoarchaeota archaeon]